MTRNAPEPDSDATDPPAADARSRAWSDVDEFDAAEAEAREDDAERERRKDGSALIGLVALVLVLLLAGLGFYATVSNAQDQPANPEIGRQVPAPPAP